MKLACKGLFVLLGLCLASCSDDSSSTNVDDKNAEIPALNCAKLYGMPDSVEWTSDISENIYARQNLLDAVSEVIPQSYKKIHLFYDAESNGYKADVTIAEWYRSFDNRYESASEYSISTPFYGCFINNFKDSRGHHYSQVFPKLDECLCKYGENGVLFSKSPTPIDTELVNEDVDIVDIDLCQTQYKAMKQKTSENYKGVYGEYVDIRDNRVYKTVEIGSQTWLAENMRYHENPDDLLAYNDTMSNFNFETYESVNSRDTVHGRYYHFGIWEKICPAGFHLPSLEEWYKLIKFVMDDQQLECDYAFAYLKNPDDWRDNDKNPSFDIYGFGALADGGYDPTLAPGGIYNKGFQTFYAAKNALCYITDNLKFNCGIADPNALRPLVINSLAPIRCVKD
jgi:uncharacterized protein (TIGR02145 family)